MVGNGRWEQRRPRAPLKARTSAGRSTSSRTASIAGSAQSALRVHSRYRDCAPFFNVQRICKGKLWSLLRIRRGIARFARSPGPAGCVLRKHAARPQTQLAAQRVACAVRGSSDRCGDGTAIACADPRHPFGSGHRAWYLPPRLMPSRLFNVPRGIRPSTRQNPLFLTSREVQFLSLVAHGHSHWEIADQLVISTRMVDHHASAVIGKLGVQGCKQAVLGSVEPSLLDQNGHPTSAR